MGRQKYFRFWTLFIANTWHWKKLPLNERQRGSTYLGDVRACFSWKILKSKVPEIRFPAFEAKVIPNYKHCKVHGTHDISRSYEAWKYYNEQKTSLGFSSKIWFYTRRSLNWSILRVSRYVHYLYFQNRLCKCLAPPPPPPPWHAGIPANCYYSTPVKSINCNDKEVTSARLALATKFKLRQFKPSSFPFHYWISNSSLNSIEVSQYSLIKTNDTDK
jgi:hypothetical protein